MLPVYFKDRKLLLGLGVLLLLVFAILPFVPRNKQSTTNISTPNKETHEVKKVFNVEGTVSEVNLKDKPEASAEAVLSVTVDSSTVYKIPVNSKTQINKYSIGTTNAPMKLLTDKEKWQSLKVGERVHIFSFVDMAQKEDLKVVDIQALDWYQTEGPK